jgi:hypothetical protein
VGGFVAIMLILPKVHLFYDLGVNDWGEANYRVRAVDALRTQPGLFRVASVLPLQPAYAYAQGSRPLTAGPTSIRRSTVTSGCACWSRSSPRSRSTGRSSASTAAEPGQLHFLGTDLVQAGVGLLPGEDVYEALRNGFDIDRRFRLDLLRLLNVRYLLSEYPLRGTGIRMVHAADPWPSWPEYRSRNTGLVEGARRPPLIDFGSVQPLVLPLWDYIEASRRKLRGKDVFVYELDGQPSRFRLVDTILVEPTARRSSTDSRRWTWQPCAPPRCWKPPMPKRSPHAETWREAPSR